MMKAFPGVIASSLLLGFATCLPAAAQDGVKLLYGFEIEEIKAGFNRQELEGYFVGKPTTDKIKGGWRVKDHVEELKLPENHDGPVTVYRNNGSYDTQSVNLFRTGATQGKYARMYSPVTGGSEIASWKYIVSYSGGTGSGLMAEPGKDGYHDIQDWFWQRYVNFFDDELAHSHEQRDWSAYEVLRLDFLAEGNPAVIGVRVFDSSGPKIPAHYLGLRSRLAVFGLPKDQQVTVEFPLAALTQAAEMDLKKMMGFIIRMNGYKGEYRLYMDNFRLVTKAAMAADAKFPLVKMQGEIGPFGRPVLDKHTVRDAAKLARKTGPVEKIGPVVAVAAKGLYSSFGGLLGGGGWTYSQSLRRGLAAYDNDRLAFIYGDSEGIRATASFDGGKTWGGLQPGVKEPAKFAWGHFRATTTSDTNGDIYMIGTEECSSYHEGYDVLLRRLALTGAGWELDRKSLVCQTLRKCPKTARAWRLPSGRIWMAWTDGWEGCVAKYSDDDAITWTPCKDAALAPPRPLYEPKLEDLAKPPAQRPAPPKEILPFPGTPVPGAILAPLRDGLAFLSDQDDKWQVFENGKWGAMQKAPFAGDATFLGTDHIFRAKGGSYGDRIDTEKRGDLLVTEFLNGQWTPVQTLEAGQIGDVTLVASGDTVFLFYVKAVSDEPDKVVNDIRLRRWRDGRWGESELLATENYRINRLGTPVVAPAAYVPLLWDARVTSLKGAPTAIKFLRLPNGP
jgi:hypothetical protein